MHRQIAALAREIEAAVPDADVDFAEFPSGAAMLDVRHQGHLYVLAYSPAHGFGVDEVLDGEGFLTSYRFTCDQFEPAASRLRALVADGVATRP